jgi:putative permease
MTLSRKQLWRDLTYVAVIAGTAGLIGYAAGRSLIPFFASCFVAFVLAPLVEVLERRGMSRLQAVGAIYGIGVIVAFAAVLYLTPVLQHQVQTFRMKLPEYSAQAQERLEALQIEWETRFPELKRVNLAQTVTKNTTAFVDQSLDRLPKIMFNLLTLVTVFVLIPIMSWYLLLESRAIKKFVIGLVPNRYFEAALNLLYRVDQHLSRYLAGLLVDAIVVGLMLAVGYSIIGVPLGIAIGVSSGLVHLIPYLGPVFGAVVAFLLTVFESGVTIKLVYVLIVASAVHLFDALLIQPLVLSKTADLHPLTVLMVLLIGGNAFGIWGMLLGVPAFCVGRIIVQEYLGILRRQQGQVI